ncbi:hypothetical protein L9W92_17460 [Pelotomaculum terephthalicicum JT]|uniref:hypothetical protein n=1 Tax=Pelotomaculum terephthalicicum TaxID=206393 RepID=UPI001F04505E|nr:hypothetical protein [Pelotomaculum terephthalicicum]MCG9969792.1 hypothetical protein [Pelotomaculum terephthalicicum JT]
MPNILEGATNKIYGLRTTRKKDQEKQKPGAVAGYLSNRLFLLNIKTAVDAFNIIPNGIESTKYFLV